MKPRVWTVFVAYAVAFWGISAAGVVIAVVVLVRAIRNDDLAALTDPKAVEALVKVASTEPWAILVSAGSTALVFGGVAVAAARFSPLRIVERLRLRPAPGGKRRFAVPPLAAVAALAAGSVVGGALELLVGRKSDALLGFENAVRSSGLMLVVTFVIIAGTTPIGEELFFRGYAQTRLVARYGRGLGIVMATALFAVLHLDPMHVAVAFAIGVVLAWTTERTGSIRAAMFAHSANNGLFVASAQATEAPATTWASVIVFGLVGMVALAGIALLTREPVPRLP